MKFLLEDLEKLSLIIKTQEQFFKLPQKMRLINGD